MLGPRGVVLTPWRRKLHRIHVEPTIGNPRLRAAGRPRQLRALYRGVSPALARNIHGALRGAFRWAVADELIERDPTDLVKPPAYRKPEARYLDLEDVRRLRGLVTGERLEGAVILGLAGLRGAEACLVRWGDVADNVLHVRGSSWGGTTKTGHTRSLTLPAGEVAALRASKTREAGRLLKVGVRIDERTTILTDGLGDPMGSKYLGARSRRSLGKMAYRSRTTPFGHRRVADAGERDRRPNGGRATRPRERRHDPSDVLTSDRAGRPGRRGAPSKRYSHAPPVSSRLAGPASPLVRRVSRIGTTSSDLDGRHIG
jgi:integrase